MGEGGSVMILLLVLCNLFGSLTSLFRLVAIVPYPNVTILFKYFFTY